MEQQLISEIFDIIRRLDRFSITRHRIVVGVWDDDSTVYAAIEDMAAPGSCLYGESSYGKYTVIDALIALRDELLKLL